MSRPLSKRKRCTNGSRCKRGSKCIYLHECENCGADHAAWECSQQEQGHREGKVSQIVESGNLKAKWDGPLTKSKHCVYGDKCWNGFRCKYLHVCQKCGSDHPARACQQTANATLQPKPDTFGCAVCGILKMENHDQRLEHINGRKHKEQEMIKTENAALYNCVLCGIARTMSAISYTSHIAGNRHKENAMSQPLVGKSSMEEQELRKEELMEEELRKEELRKDEMRKNELRKAFYRAAESNKQSELQNEKTPTKASIGPNQAEKTPTKASIGPNQAAEELRKAFSRAEEFNKQIEQKEREKTPTKASISPTQAADRTQAAAPNLLLQQNIFSRPPLSSAPTQTTGTSAIQPPPTQTSPAYPTAPPPPIQAAAPAPPARPPHPTQTALVPPTAPFTPTQTPPAPPAAPSPPIQSTLAPPIAPSPPISLPGDPAAPRPARSETERAIETVLRAFRAGNANSPLPVGSEEIAGVVEKAIEEGMRQKEADERH